MTTLTVNYQDILNRCASVQREALTDAGEDVDAYPYWLHTQASFPYFVNRVSRADFSFDSDYIQDKIVIVEFLLLVGHYQEGQTNGLSEIETKFYDLLPIVEKAFACQYRDVGLFGGAWLTTSETGFTTPPTYLQETGVFLNGHTGFSTIPHSGVGQQQLGTRYTLTVPCMQDIGGV